MHVLRSVQVGRTYRTRDGEDLVKIIGLVRVRKGRYKSQARFRYIGSDHKVYSHQGRHYVSGILSPKDLTEEV